MAVAEVVEIFVPAGVAEFGYLRTQGRWGSLSTFMVPLGVLDGMADQVLLEPDFVPRVDTHMAMKSRDYARTWPPSGPAKTWLVREGGTGGTRWSIRKGDPGRATELRQQQEKATLAGEVAAQVIRDASRIFADQDSEEVLSSDKLEAIQEAAERLLAAVAMDRESFEHVSSELWRPYNMASIRHDKAAQLGHFQPLRILWKAEELAGWEEDEDDDDDEDEWVET